MTHDAEDLAGAGNPLLGSLPAALTAEALALLRPHIEGLWQAWQQLTAAAAAAAIADQPRPRQPTRAWCLPIPGTVRWERHAHLRPRLWGLLAYLLDRLDRPDRAVPIDALEDHVYGREVPDRRVATDLSALNSVLLEVQFPWDYHVRRGFIVRDV